MTDNAYLVRADAASLVLNKQQVLNRISLHIAPSEILTIIGPNGAGKSSLLKLIIGEHTPTSGTLHKSAHCRIGYMPQRLHIDPSLPLNVSRFLSLSGNNDSNALTQTLQEVEAAHLAERAMQSLSGGEQQRVLLARALLRDPNLLVLDEPTQGVDIHGQREFYRLLDTIRDERHCAIVQVSHDLHFVMASTDQVLCLNHHICCSGSAESVAQHPEYRALFGAELGKDIAIYTHDHDHHHSLDGDVCDHDH